MKHVKTFETYNINNIEIGNYVIMKSKLGWDEYDTFIDNNIGIVYNISNLINYEVGVRYANVPNKSDIKEYFSEYGYRLFQTSQIEYMSNNKEELETILQAKKYNL